MTSTRPDPLLLQALDALCSKASPYGGERPLAESLREWGSARWPGVQWEVVDTADTWGGDQSAALLATASSGQEQGGLLLYSHLDTSLSGVSHMDAAVIGDGRAAHPVGWGLEADGEAVAGFGMGVAKAPAAAALVAFTEAVEALSDSGRRFRLQLLLASRGTHRCVLTPTGEFHRPIGGAQAYLAAGHRPDAVVVAKCGPPTVLLEEPAAFYARIDVTSDWGVVMMRRSHTPDGGLLPFAARLIDSVEAWAAAFAARSEPESVCGHEFGLGWLGAGEPGKPDLLPGRLSMLGYGVMPGPVDADALRESLSGALQERLASTPGGSPLLGAIRVRVEALEGGGRTDPEQRLARRARAAWQEAIADDAPEPLRWTGSTDGALFRAAGLPTARLGPCLHRAAVGSSEAVDVSSWLRCRSTYRTLALQDWRPEAVDESFKELS